MITVASSHLLAFTIAYYSSVPSGPIEAQAFAKQESRTTDRIKLEVQAHNLIRRAVAEVGITTAAGGGSGVESEREQWNQDLDQLNARLAASSRPSDFRKALNESTSPDDERSVILAHWLNDSPSEAIAYLEDNSELLRSQDIIAVLGLYARKYGAEGLVSLSAGKEIVQKSVLAALLREDPVAAYDLQDSFSSDNKKALLSKVFSFWPLERRQEGLERFVEDLGGLEYMRAVFGIAGRLSGTDLIEWTEAAIAEGLPERTALFFRESIQYKQAYLRAKELPLEERVNGTAVRASSKEIPSPEDLHSSATKIVGHDVREVFRDKPEFGVSFEVGDSNGAEAMARIREALPEIAKLYPEMLLEAGFKELASLNPGAAVDLLPEFEEADRFQVVLDAAKNVNGLNVTLEEVIDVLQMIPSPSDSPLLEQRNRLLSNHLRSHYDELGSVALTDWIVRQPRGEEVAYLAVELASLMESNGEENVSEFRDRFGIPHPNNQSSGAPTTSEE